MVKPNSDVKTPIAIPDFVTDQGRKNELSEEVTDLVRKDFRLTNMFKVLDEKSLVGEDTGDTIDFSKWASLDAALLLKGQVNSGGRHATI